MERTMKHCTLRFRSSQFKCEVRVNDVPVVRLSSGQNLSTAFSVNEWLNQGENVLSVDLSGNTPDLPESALLHIDVGLADSVHGEAMNLVTLEFGPNDAGAGLVVRPLPVPTMPFAEYDDHLLQPIDLTDKDQLRDFLRTYGIYYQALASKDLTAIMRFHEYRCAAYDNRYYYPRTTRYHKLQEELAHSFANEFLLLRGPELEKVNAHMGGRLLTMDYVHDGNPLASFTGKEGDYIRSYQTFWGRDPQGEYFIYR